MFHWVIVTCICIYEHTHTLLAKSINLYLYYLLMLFYFLSVDSIGWVRADSIVLGCFEVGDDSEQASYFIQVITTQSLEITDVSIQYPYTYLNLFS